MSLLLLSIKSVFLSCIKGNNFCEFLLLFIIRLITCGAPLIVIARSYLFATVVSYWNQPIINDATSWIMRNIVQKVVLSMGKISKRRRLRNQLLKVSDIILMLLIFIIFAHRYLLATYRILVWQTFFDEFTNIEGCGAASTIKGRSSLSLL